MATAADECERGGSIQQGCACRCWGTSTTGSKETIHATSDVKSQHKQKSMDGGGGRSRSNSRVQSSDLNTGDSAILGAVVGEDICDNGNGDGYDCNDPLRDIFGDDVEEATRDHRRRIMEKARALQVAERRRREVEVQSIKEHLERHDSVLSDEARMDAEARLASSVRSGVGANANASGSASQKMAGSSASSVDESIREGTSSGGDNARAPQHEQQQTPGASWSVASHPLSLSRYARDFISIGLLASGAFGDVYRAKSKFDQSEYAIKRVCFTAKGFDSATVQTVIREVQCLAQLDHRNVVRYVVYFVAGFDSLEYSVCICMQTLQLMQVPLLLFPVLQRCYSLDITRGLNPVG